MLNNLSVYFEISQKNTQTHELAVTSCENLAVLRPSGTWIDVNGV